VSVQGDGTSSCKVLAECKKHGVDGPEWTTPSHSHKSLKNKSLRPTGWSLAWVLPQGWPEVAIGRPFDSHPVQEPNGELSMNKKGFTLIELLIVVVIIGILAAIAIPRFGQTRERAYVSAMQSDLNQLRTAMEMCLQANTGDDAFTYNSCDESLINASSGVTIEVTVADGGASYTADATHTATEEACAYSSTTGTNTC